VPWLCAYTGARVGELTQLRVQDTELRACGPVLRITPDAGTVKTGKARTVPIHPHLVEMGLLDYVEAVKARLGKQGPLFFRPPARPSRNPSYRGSAVKARERLAKWVRELGITDSGIQPSHAWRHSFKRRAARAGIEPRIRDGICGHTPRTVAESYELPTVEDMAVAIQKLPRWKDRAPMGHRLEAEAPRSTSAFPHVKPIKANPRFGGAEVLRLLVPMSRDVFVGKNITNP
jgi:integrase